MPCDAQSGKNSAAISVSRNNDLVTQTLHQASAVFFLSPDHLLQNRPTRNDRGG